MHEQDRRLAKQLESGREEAFKRFFDDYFPRVYRFCTRRLREDAAEEITQTVLVNAIRNIGRYRGEASLFTWLCQIARHEVSTYYRQSSRQDHIVLMDDSEVVKAELESLSADPELGPESLAAGHQGREIIQVILDHLPGDYGRVLEWKYIEGFSVEEIAQRLATTPIAVQSMLARARGAFRRQYLAVSDEMDLLTGDHGPGEVVP